MVKTSSPLADKVTILGRTFSKKTFITGTVATIVGLGILGTGGFYYYQKHQDYDKDKNEEFVQEEEQIEEIVIEPEEIKTKECKSEKLGITMQIPENWSCEEVAIQKEGDNYWGTIELKSDTIKAEILNVGAGSKGDMECIEDCEKISFYTRKDIIVKEYKLDNPKKINISGYFDYPDSFGNISFVHINNQEEDFTELEKKEINIVLDSLKVLKKEEKNIMVSSNELFLEKTEVKYSRIAKDQGDNVEYFYFEKCENSSCQIFLINTNKIFKTNNNYLQLLKNNELFTTKFVIKGSLVERGIATGNSYFELIDKINIYLPLEFYTGETVLDNITNVQRDYYIFINRDLSEEDYVSCKDFACNHFLMKKNVGINFTDIIESKNKDKFLLGSDIKVSDISSNKMGQSFYDIYSDDDLDIDKL